MNRVEATILTGLAASIGLMPDSNAQNTQAQVTKQLNNPNPATTEVAPSFFHDRPAQFPGVRISKAAEMRRLMLPYSPRYFAEPTPVPTPAIIIRTPTPTPTPRLEVTPTPETLAGQLERSINLFERIDFAQETLDGQDYTFEMKIEPGASYTFAMRSDLKQQAMHFMAENGKKGGFRKVYMLGFARASSIPRPLIYWFAEAYPQGSPPRGIGYFYAVSVQIKGENYRISYFAPPPEDWAYEGNLAEATRQGIGYDLMYVTVKGDSFFNPKAPRTTEEQRLRINTLKPVYLELTTLRPR